MSKSDLSLGELVRQLRVEAGLSTRKLAELAGVNQSNISRLELGQAPRSTMSSLTRDRRGTRVSIRLGCTRLLASTDADAALPSLRPYLQGQVQPSSEGQGRRAGGLLRHDRGRAGSQTETEVGAVRSCSPNLEPRIPNNEPRFTERRPTMSLTTNQSSLLFQLRSLMPMRPLYQGEALRIAELQANRLLAACGITSAGTPSRSSTAFPNLRVSKRSDLPASGLAVWYKPHWQVYLNAHEPSVRQRFSLFHELKHVLDHPVIGSCYPSATNASSEKRAELVADYFAACVLMPKRFVRSAYFQGQHNVEELAAVFGVSPVAMTFRLQQLGILDRTRRCEQRKRPRPNLPGYFRQAWDHASTGGGVGAFMKNAVIYIRVSTKQQAARDGNPEGYSLPTQREACLRKAESMGAVVVDEYVDKDTGTAVANVRRCRNCCTELRTNSDVELVIVHKLDRWARNTREDLVSDFTLKSAGAQLVSCSETIDRTAAGRLLHSMLASVNEYHSRNMGDEIRRKTLMKIQQGGTPGVAPLGYKNVGEGGRRYVVIDPEPAELITLGVETYATGDWTAERLLDEVTERGLRSRGGPTTPRKELVRSQMHRILTRPYYKGIVRYNDVDYQGKHEPLVRMPRPGSGCRTS